MIFPLPHLLAAIDVQILFAIVIGIISFISWISKSIKENKENQDQQKNPKAGVEEEQDHSIRNEIESFLQDVLGQKPQRKQGDEEDFLELVEDEPPHRKKQLQKKTDQKPKQIRIEDRSVGQSASVFGSSLQEHVSTHMQPKYFEDDLGHNVDQSVAQHLGAFSGSGDEIQLASNSDQLRGEVLDMLRNPEDVRKAIVLNLILTPPSSLKKNE